MRLKILILLVTLLMLSLVPALTTDLGASSHREAPMIAEDPTADVTDLYAFISPDAPDTVTIISNWIPFQDPAGGPNFYKFSQDAAYVIKIDNDGDKEGDITYTFTFRNQYRNRNSFLYNTGLITSLDDPDYNHYQTYQVYRAQRQTGTNTSVSYQVLANNLIVPPVNIGPNSTPDYDALASQAVYLLPGNRKVFVGQRDDPFFADLGTLFDLLSLRPGAPGDAGGGRDDLSGYNVHTIALQIPIQELWLGRQEPADYTDPRASVGIWAAAYRPNVRVIDPRLDTAPSLNRLVQVSRLGNPLVNEVLIPLDKKDRWNDRKPAFEYEFISYFLNPEPAGLLNQIYGLNAPTNNRTDLDLILLRGFPEGVIPGFANETSEYQADMLRLNTLIPPTTEAANRFGLLGGDLTGYPNGRRLTDDVVDIVLRAVAGVTYPLVDSSYEPHPLAGRLGDGVDHNDVPFLPNFPYLANPHQGVEHEHHRMEPTPEATPTVSFNIFRR